MFCKCLRALFIELLCMLLFCVRKLLGPIRCRYPVGCTTFTIGRLRTTPMHRALWAALRRICSCSSWGPLRQDLF